MSILFVVMLILFIALMSATSHIPKTGRDPEAKGKKITAIITNRNKTADKAVVLRAKAKDGRKFKVKLKPSEAKLWIKGDEIRVVLSESNPKKYRVLFHEYFKQNEDRIRKHAIENLEKKVKKLIAARIVGYSEKTLKAFKMCSIETHDIFVFTTFMRMLDVYSVVAAFLAISFISWYMASNPTFIMFIIPLVVLIMLILLLKGSADVCKRIKTEAISSAKKNKAKAQKEQKAE